MTDFPSPRSGPLGRWGGWVARHAHLVLGIWLVAIPLSFVVPLGVFGNPALFSRLHASDLDVPGQNRTGRELLARITPAASPTVTLLLSGVAVSSPRAAAAGRESVDTLRAIPGVTTVFSPYAVPTGPTSPAAGPLLAQGSATPGFATIVYLAAGQPSDARRAAYARIDAAFDTLVRDSGASTSSRGGGHQLLDRIIAQIKTDGQRGEGIALPISFLLMIVVFGGLVAAGIPILGAIASIGGALVLLLGFSYVLDLDAAVVNVVSVLGLGLCIDYGLLVVSRFREEVRRRHPGVDPRGLPRADVGEATAETLHRAGRTVVFSAVIVSISLAGLMVFDIPFIRAVSAAGVSVVLLALAVGLSLVPACCVLGAQRILRRGTEFGSDTGVFARLATVVQRLPWITIVVVTALLLLLALPATRMTTTSSGAALLPRGTPERDFAEDLARHYPALAGGQMALVTQAPVAAVRTYTAGLADLPGVTFVSQPHPIVDGVVSVAIRTQDNGTGPASRAVVAHLRAHPPSFPAWTVGQASALRDFSDVVRARAPAAILLVCLATLTLLFLMTGSLVVPVKALVMNVLSLGATLGVLVWIFQKGNLATLLGFSPTGAVESTVPVLVLAFGFGLSMDYEVFLLARIVELHEQGLPTGDAVRLGLQRSGRIITSAALLMVIVFGGFAAADLLVMKEMGVALAIAIVIDATIVRMLLVPATMSVLGPANWWAPARLRRWHARWGIAE